MLKKISVTDVRLGMHLHKLEGAWISHPFWKTRFVIDTADDLKALRSSGVSEIWIDNELGLDVGSAGPWVAPSEAARDVVAARLPAGAKARPPLRQRGQEEPLQAEMREAAAICSRGREAVTAMFSEARMGRGVNAEQCLPLVEDITNSVARNPGAMVSLARLKTKDDYSYMHSVAVCALMVALGRQLGMSDDECREAGLAGLMHDIGKAMVPLEILNKPSRLTDEEFAQVRKHPEQGHHVLLEGGSTDEAVMDVVLHHHERFDGKGYPFGLAGEQISRLARMGSLCDVYDAITSNRPYKAGWDPAESIARMASWKGQFDAPTFSALVQSLGIYPTGSLVRLESGHLAVVVAQNPGALVNPVVKRFYSVKRQLPVTPQVVDLAAAGCHDRIVAREQRLPGQFPWLDELWADAEVLRRMSGNPQ
jgi:HD-GYP domain-containing protein (c-di-GMP phosphodiesterase class II)